MQCTAKGAEFNGFSNVTTELNLAQNYDGSRQFDLVLANPPYFAAFGIAEEFLLAGFRALRSGGSILAVTQKPRWYEENMPNWIEDVVAHEVKNYYIVRGRRP